MINNNVTRQIRVSDDIIGRYRELVSSKLKNLSKNAQREQVDLALQFFIDQGMLPTEFEKIDKRLTKETGRYISFFKVTEKSIYDRMDQLTKAMEYAPKGGDGLENYIGDQLKNTNNFLKIIYELIRLSYLLNLQTIQIVAESQEEYDEIYEDFKKRLEDIERSYM